MKSFIFALLLLAALCVADNNPIDLERALANQDAETNAKHTWVVLAAGSTDFYNYRHQASVCHMYQVARKLGIPDSRIIVFMADDIANSYENPFPGQIFNYFYIRGGHNVNVYDGVVKDYVGENATTENLLAVLKGEVPKSGSGKTLQTTKDDNVFFYYDDHGNIDIIAMPYGRDFTGDDVADLFDTLREKQNYKSWVLFVQACMSGSMFYKQDFPENVYAATSAPTDSSAYACFMDQTIGVYVTSCWPRGWIPPLEDGKPASVTIGDLYADAYDWVVPNSTEPCQYGDADVKQYTVKQFFNVRRSSDLLYLSQTRDRRLERADRPVRQEDVPLEYARWRYQKTHSEEDRLRLQEELRFRQHVDKIVTLAAEAAVADHDGIFRAEICKEDACDDSCPCYKTCMRSKSPEECSVHCCGNKHCYEIINPEEGEDPVECAATLSRAFRSICGSSKNDYLVSASRTFHRICRMPGHNINAAIKVFQQYC